MSQSLYDYSNRNGILPVSWEDFHGICKALAAAAASFEPQNILPIGRGGYYPGTLLAHMLQVEIFPVRVSRRVNDVVRHTSPQWIVTPPVEVAGRRVLVVDEISSTGETLLMVMEKTAALGAVEVRSAVLYAHSRGVDVPDYVGLVTDALLLNPWDREVYVNGGFQFHPEYAQALAEQGFEPSPELLVPAADCRLAKG